MSVLDLSAVDYHADEIDDRPSLSASIACIICSKSPAHAQAAHPKLNPDFEQETSDAFDLGTVAHSLLLEGESRVELILADNWTTKLAREQRTEAREAGLIPLLQKDADRVFAMVEAARVQLGAHEAQPALLTDGKPEQSLVWEDNGVLCRARLDWLRDDHAAIDDYKTSQSANPDWFARKGIYDHGYDVKAAFYLRAVKAVTGVDAEFRWIVQEKKPPYALSVVSPGADVLALAAEKVSYAIDLWRGCLENDAWPAYTTRVAYAELPGWEETRWLEKTEMEKAA